MREWFTEDEPAPDCRCRTEFERETLAVDASDCPGDGRLGEAPDCRATVVAALGQADVESVVTTSDGVERAYLDGDAALLVAAGRFATRVAATDATFGVPVGQGAKPLAVRVPQPDAAQGLQLPEEDPRRAN